MQDSHLFLLLCSSLLVSSYENSLMAITSVIPDFLVAATLLEFICTIICTKVKADIPF